MVNFDGGASLIKQFVDLEITEALPNSMRGQLAAPAHRYQVANGAIAEEMHGLSS